jgi:3-phenylpropionate/cinnamic acid dioxygenase small subunit
MIAMDDLHAIEQLVARYAISFDERDVETWLACWTTDGTLHRTNGQLVTGHRALGEYLRAFPGRGRHVVSNSVIEIRGDLASHRSYVQYFDRESQHALLMFGVYNDQIARVGETWRFASRRPTPDAADRP